MNHEADLAAAGCSKLGGWRYGLMIRKVAEQHYLTLTEFYLGDGGKIISCFEDPFALDDYVMLEDLSEECVRAAQREIVDGLLLKIADAMEANRNPIMESGPDDTLVEWKGT